MTWNVSRSVLNLNMYEHFRTVSVHNQVLFVQKSHNRGYSRKSVYHLPLTTAKESVRQTLTGFQKLCELSGQKFEWFLEVWFKTRPDDFHYFVRKFIDNNACLLEAISNPALDVELNPFVSLFAGYSWGVNTSFHQSPDLNLHSIEELFLLFQQSHKIHPSRSFHHFHIDTRPQDPLFSAYFQPLAETKTNRPPWGSNPRPQG